MLGLNMQKNDGGLGGEKEGDKEVHTRWDHSQWEGRGGRGDVILVYDYHVAGKKEGRGARSSIAVDPGFRFKGRAYSIYYYTLRFLSTS